MCKSKFTYELVTSSKYCRDDIFETVFEKATKRFVIISLHPGVKIHCNVIDCWTEVLNFDEQKRSINSPYRLFCNTSLIVSSYIYMFCIQLLEDYKIVYNNFILLQQTENMLNDEQMDDTTRSLMFQSNLMAMLSEFEHGVMDLKTFDIVLFPIVEKDHYYLVCFDLKNPAIQVIDNIHESHSFVGLEDAEDYKLKDTVLKVVICCIKT